MLDDLIRQFNEGHEATRPAGWLYNSRGPLFVRHIGDFVYIALCV